MGKIGKISVIPKEYSEQNGMQTMQSSLSRIGRTRVPGTGVFKYPYKEFDGRYRTGLDPNASYIQRIEDKTEREVEIERVKKLLKRVQNAFGDVDLGPKSQFWNHSKSSGGDDYSHAQPYKLIDGDNIFDLDNVFLELTFGWLRVHPTIASSLSAYQSGLYSADTQFYISDGEVESQLLYKKKENINGAVMKFHQMTPEKRKKVARLLGLPISDNSRDEEVYNSVDTLLKKQEIEAGAYKGMSPVETFNRFADMAENLLHVRDLVKQAIGHSIYRLRPNGRIYEGEAEISTDEDSLVKYLVDDDHQEDLLTLESKLKAKKKLAS